jgi:hypothetical protein
MTTRRKIAALVADGFQERGILRHALQAARFEIEV